jgi:hypothetical protein
VAALIAALHTFSLTASADQGPAAAVTQDPAFAREYSRQYAVLGDLSTTVLVEELRSVLEEALGRGSRVSSTSLTHQSRAFEREFHAALQRGLCAGGTPVAAATPAAVRAAAARGAQEAGARADAGLETADFGRLAAIGTRLVEAAGLDRLCASTSLAELAL